MAVVAVTIGGAAIGVLYDTAIHAERARLVVSAQSQRYLIEALARHEMEEVYERKRHTPAEAYEDTLEQLKDARKHYHGFGRSGEFTLARRQGERIVYILALRHDDLDEPRPVAWDSNIAEPMRHALMGHSGTMVGLDYRGVEVLAAYEPIPALDLGIVVKIDMDEIRAPFLRAGGIVAVIAVLVIAVGTFLFFAVSNPMIRLIEESEERLRAIIENSPTAISLKDAAGRYFLVNRKIEELSGLTSDEIIGRTSDDVFPREFARSTMEHEREVIRSGQASFVEETCPTPEGERILLTTKFPIFDSAREIRFIGGIYVDITERKHNEEKMSELQRELAHISRVSTLGEMAAGLAHELNQPLTAITNYAKGVLLRLDAGDGAAVDMPPIMERIAEQALRAGDVIRRIRGFLEQAAPKTATVDINTAIRQALTLLTGEIQVGGVMMKLELLDPLPHVMADMIQLQQVILNLSRNAVEAMVDHGCEPRRLTIGTARVKEDAIEVFIRDTGPGIPDDILKQVFDPFFTTKDGGLGMGLAISRSIVNAHHGWLEITSEVGTGTTVHFTLPIAAGDTHDVA